MRRSLEGGHRAWERLDLHGVLVLFFIFFCIFQRGVRERDGHVLTLGHYEMQHSYPRLGDRLL